MNLHVKPYLSDIMALFRRVRDFDEAVTLSHTYTLRDDSFRHYIKEDIEEVVESFAKRFELSVEDSEVIKDAMSAGEIDFMNIVTEGAFMPEDDFRVLFLLSRPFFHSVRGFPDGDNRYWQEGRCPVCKAFPSISLIEENSPRIYFCSYCGATGDYRRIGCPVCLNEDPRTIDIMYLADIEDVRIDACNACKTYVKTFRGMPDEHGFEEMDILSLDFDIVAQGSGFSRKSPNPVGIVSIR